jgi:hypothetical protein
MPMNNGARKQTKNTTNNKSACGMGMAANELGRVGSVPIISLLDIACLLLSCSHRGLVCS